MEEKKLYTTPEVAQALGVSNSHVRNMVRTGIAKPTQQIGGTWIFTLDEIERLRGRKRTPGRVKKK
jgi:excisionase family DNA binding protein